MSGQRQKQCSPNTTSNGQLRDTNLQLKAKLTKAEVKRLQRNLSRLDNINVCSACSGSELQERTLSFVSCEMDSCSALVRVSVLVTVRLRVVGQLLVDIMTSKAAGCSYSTAFAGERDVNKVRFITDVIWKDASESRCCFKDINGLASEDAECVTPLCQDDILC